MERSSSLRDCGLSTEQFIERLHDAGWWLAPAWSVYGDWPEPNRRACCCSDGLLCTQAGKHPLAKWRGQPRPSLAELADLLAWHRRLSYGHPFNVGVRNKASNLCTLDIDRHAGGPDGIASWAALTDQHGQLPRTVADTRGHFYFRPPVGDWSKSAWQLAPGVELFGGSDDRDHLTYCPPSRHASGTDYAFLPGCAPWETEPAPLPGWIESLRRSLEVPAAPPTATEARYRAYRQARRDAGIGGTPFNRARGWLNRRPCAVRGQGGHYHQLKTAWTLVKGFGLSESEALSLFTEWDRGSSPPRRESELRAMIAGAAAKGGPVGWALDRDKPARVPVRAVGRKTLPPDPDAKQDYFPDLTDAQLRAIAEPRPPRTEEAAANVIRRLRHGSYRCLKAKTVVTQSYDWKTEAHRVNFIQPRCDCWSCPACSQLHREEWQVNYRLRLLHECLDPDGPAYVVLCPAEKQKLYTDRIRRLDGNYFYLDAGDGERLIVSDVKFKGGDETTRRNACDRLCRTIAAYDGSRKPGGSSRRWQIPKLQRSESTHTRIGVLDGDLSDEVLDAALEAERLVGKDVEPPFQHRFRVVRWRVAELAGPVSRRRLLRLYYRLYDACPRPEKAARDQPYKSPEGYRADRAPTLLSYAEVPD